MEELYHAIEKKITEAGYPRSISGEAVYNDICDQIDEACEFRRHHNCLLEGDPGFSFC